MVLDKVGDEQTFCNEPTMNPAMSNADSDDKGCDLLHPHGMMCVGSNEYIYSEKERARERDREKERDSYTYIYIYICICIYLYINICLCVYARAYIHWSYRPSGKGLRLVATLW